MKSQLLTPAAVILVALLIATSGQGAEAQSSNSTNSSLFACTANCSNTTALLETLATFQPATSSQWVVTFTITFANSDSPTTAQISLLRVALADALGVSSSTISIVFARRRLLASTAQVTMTANSASAANSLASNLINNAASIQSSVAAAGLSITIDTSSVSVTAPTATAAPAAAPVSGGGGGGGGGGGLPAVVDEVVPEGVKISLVPNQPAYPASCATACDVKSILGDGNTYLAASPAFLIETPTPVTVSIDIEFNTDPDAVAAILARRRRMLLAVAPEGYEYRVASEDGVCDCPPFTNADKATCEERTTGVYQVIVLSSTVCAEESSGGLSAGEIIGIIIGVLAGLGLCGAAAYFNGQGGDQTANKPLLSQPAEQGPTAGSPAPVYAPAVPQSPYFGGSAPPMQPVYPGAPMPPIVPPPVSPYPPMSQPTSGAFVFAQ